jgi:palmitoyltransferase ZDHHC1/11
VLCEQVLRIRFFNHSQLICYICFALSVYYSPVRGLERPFSNDQITTTLLHILLVVYFCALCAVSLSARQLIAVLVPYWLLQIGLASLWFYVGLVDPATSGGVVLPGRSTSLDSRRYCPACRKVIVNYDHHCSFLNCCIGQRNYAQFYLLTMIGTTLYTLQVVIGIITLTVWLNKEQLASVFGSDSAGYIAWGVFIGVSACVGASFISLCSFHTYLIGLGKGTYDYIVETQLKREARRHAKREKLSTAPKADLLKEARAEDAHLKRDRVADSSVP